MSFRDAQIPEEVRALWYPTQAAKPAGPPAKRPKGRAARSALADRFTEAIAADFDAHGEAVIAQARVKDPVAYLKVVTSLLPKDLSISSSEDVRQLLELVARGSAKVIEENGQRYLELEAKDITPAANAAPAEGRAATSSASEEILA